MALHSLPCRDTLALLLVPCPNPLHKYGDRHLCASSVRGRNVEALRPLSSRWVSAAHFPPSSPRKGGSMFRGCLTKATTWGHCDFARRRLSTVWPGPRPLPDSSSSSQELQGIKSLAVEGADR